MLNIVAQFWVGNFVLPQSQPGSAYTTHQARGAYADDEANAQMIKAEKIIVFI